MYIRTFLLWSSLQYLVNLISKKFMNMKFVLIWSVTNLWMKKLLLQFLTISLFFLSLFLTWSSPRRYHEWTYVNAATTPKKGCPSSAEILCGQKLRPIKASKSQRIKILLQSYRFRYYFIVIKLQNFFPIFNNTIPERKHWYFQMLLCRRETASSRSSHSRQCKGALASTWRAGWSARLVVHPCVLK